MTMPDSEIYKHGGRVGNAAEALRMAVSQMRGAQQDFVDEIGTSLGEESWTGESSNSFRMAQSKIDAAICDMNAVIDRAAPTLEEMSQIIDHADITSAGLYG